MADPRRLREILGFGYGAPSPAMSALEPFHAGVDPAYMPQDVVTASPTEGPRGWVRSGLESLFGAIAPSERAASNMAEKVTNLSDFVNVPQEAFDVGQEIGNTLQGGDPRMLAMSLIPGKAPEKAAKVAKETASTLKDKITDALGGGVIDRTNTGWTFKDYKPIHNEMAKGDWRLADQLDTTEVELPIRSLFASQKTVNPDFADVPNKPVYGPGNPKATPYAIKKNGQYYLQDGHHRLTALADQGKQTAKVRVVDLDEGSPVETPLLDWTPPAPKDDLVPAVKAAQKGIKAYHGTPHDFEKFDLSKIGTGEGAQAYGHGLYFAENEGTARSYRDALSDMPPSGDPVRTIAEKLKRNGSDIEAGLRRMFPDISEEQIAATAQSARDFNPGHMYEVNINADPDAFLDWDKPLSEHSEATRQAIAAAAANFEPRGPLAKGINQNLRSGNLNLTGEQAYTGIGGLSGGPEKIAASEALKQAGIPGIKYLDAGSRTPKTLFDGQPIQSGAKGPLAAQQAAESLDLYGTPEAAIEALSRNPGYQGANIEAAELLRSGRVKRTVPEGSRNYVVFSDEIIDIVKKYGIAGALGAGLITQQMADQLEAQQGGGQS